jgi:hypothetical protein
LKRKAAFIATETIREFLAGKTDRAIKEAEEWNRKMLAMAPDQRDVRKAIRLVELSITYHPAAQMADIGGKIDAVQLEPSRTITWVQNEKKCPQD